MLQTQSAEAVLLLVAVVYCSLQLEPAEDAAFQNRPQTAVAQFDYKYRYERHVETTFHKDKVRLMEICASTEAEWESGNVDTGGSSTVTESHSPSAIASDELSLAIGDEDIGHLDEAEKDSESSSDSGRDFKFLAQIAMFIFSPYLFEAEIEVWLALSMVFKMVYCDEFEPQKIELYRDVCHRFARAIDCYSVTWRKKLKIHLILHLPDSMLRFGPASSFNTERCGEDLVNLYHTKEFKPF
eukprot:Em0022g421a